MPMKTRDKVKYAFATLLALLTCVAIVAMLYAKFQRQTVPEEERERIRTRLRTFGQPPTPDNPSPVATPQSLPTPIAVQHGATQVDPATRP